MIELELPENTFNYHVPILTLPPSNAFIAILNPSPSTPTKFSTGTLQSEKITALVGCEFHPNYRNNSSIPIPKNKATNYDTYFLFLLSKR